jgi:phosphoribosylcarboxyaminoimidazole (NCAIR) mutase
MVASHASAAPRGSDPLVAVVMGSNSDWDVLRHSAETTGRAASAEPPADR